MRLLRKLIASFVSMVVWVFTGATGPGRATGRDLGADLPNDLSGDLAEGLVVKGAFRDHGRRRLIPFKLYMPTPVAGPAPVVLFSHGLGGSREAAPYLGEELARNGYFVFFIQHPGSDESILENAQSSEEIQARLQQAMRTPGNAANRYRDIPFVLDQLAVMNTKSRIAGRLDLARVGMVGHSFGARGTMTAAGQRTGPHGLRFKEKRIRAGVAISPNVPTGQGSGPGSEQAQEGLYDAIDIPLLHITGTRDGMPLGAGDFDPATRTLPFQRIAHPEQYLLVLDGATHGSFSGRTHGYEDDDGSDPQLSQTVTTAVAIVVTLFFDAYLKGDAGARRALRTDFRLSLAPGDRFEVK